MARKSTKALCTAGVEQLEERRMFNGAAYGNVVLSLTNINPSVTVDYTLNGVDQSWGAGEFTWARSGGTYKNKCDTTAMQTFCIEPGQDVVDSTVNYTVTDLAGSKCAPSGPLSSKQADEIKELWGRFYTKIGTDGTKAAAFQMAIWEIVSDTDMNVLTGTFHIDALTATDTAVATQAQSWLNALTGCGPKANLLALTNPTDQDQVFQVDCTPPVDCLKHKCVESHTKYHCFRTHDDNSIGDRNGTGVNGNSGHDDSDNKLHGTQH